MLAGVGTTPYNVRVGMPCRVMRRAPVPPRIEDVMVVSEREGGADTDPDRRSLESVWDCARALYASGIHPALQLRVRHRGQVALDGSGKPLLYPELYHLLEIPRRIGLACPRTR
jgi:hypothetical protein